MEAMPMYDEAGNLIKKGNRYNIKGDTVIFTETEGSGVEYWEYEYNLQNRLSRVKKNGQVIAEFSYDVDGMRIKAEEKLEEIQESCICQPKTVPYFNRKLGQLK